MRIAYVCHWNLDVPDGVTKKVDLQARHWRAAGHDVTVFSLAPGAAEDRLGVRAFPYTGAAARLAASVRLAYAVLRLRPDVVYLRYDLFLPPVWPLPWLLPTVVELNTDDRAEWATRSGAAALYNEINRRALLRRARGAVAVTNEIARRAGAGRSTRVATIPNGIELDEPPPNAAPGDAPRLVFLGTPNQPWHGVDKLVALARRAPELRVDVVGYTATQLDALAAPVPENVTVHGRLERVEYERVVAGADVGVGSLALHRIGLSEAAPLKVREYLAAGLPVLVAYDDADLVGSDDWWILRLPNTEDNLCGSGDAVAAFASAVKGRRVPREIVAQLVSAEAKELRRLELLAAAASEHAPHRT